MAAGEEFYARLSPRERRQQIILEPAYRDAYNEITEAHRIVPVPNYFWENWLPVLGPVACALYIQLRRYCYHNPTTGEKRDLCWPKQDTLANEIGVKDRKTVRKGLGLLEEHGFIERERTYYRDSASGRPHQGTDRYRVYFEVPLTARDAAELLIRRTTPGRSDYVPDCYEGKKSPHSVPPVDNSLYEGKKSPHGGGEKIPTRTSTRTNTSTLTNVITKNSKNGELSFREHPAYLALSAEEHTNREALVIEVGDALHRMAGNGELEPHESEGFHRRVVVLMPERLVREALTATRDAVERGRSGKGGCVKGPGAYFAGVIKKLAEEHHVDLGLRKAGRAIGVPPESPRTPATGRNRAAETTEPDNPEMSRQEAREAIRRLVESLETKQK